jgi:amino-acid N-acetyltransferase
LSNKITIQQASLNDVEGIITLLNTEVKKGIILYRNKDMISQNIRYYIVSKLDNKIIGVGALHIYAKELGEIRSLMVDEKYRGHGIAKKIIYKILSMAEDVNVEKILVLTFIDKLFSKLGFEYIDKKDLPDYKIWQDCIKCKMFPKCEEISLIKTI